MWSRALSLLFAIAGTCPWTGAEPVNMSFRDVSVPRGLDGARFKELPPEKTGILFQNTLPLQAVLKNNNYMNGSGVAAGDFDGDGLCDLYFCAIAGTNALYRNMGGWRFQEVTQSAGVELSNLHSTGALFADTDGDGDLDLFVSTLGSGVKSFVNQGGGRFRENTAESGLASKTGSTSLALGDVDGDSDLDLYVANYGEIPIMRSGGRAEVKQVGGQWVVTGPYTNRLKIVDGRLEEFGEPDVLYLNDGNGTFRPLPWNSEYFLDEDGRPAPAPWDFGLSVQMRDVNGDGAPDLYVCNDFQTPDRFWINNGSGRFRALPRLAMRKQSYSSMGVDFADLDRDGLLDFFVVEMLSRQHELRMRQVVSMAINLPVPGLVENRPQVTRNTLFRGSGDLTYTELANYSGLAATDWAWQPVFVDADLDGDEDILVVSGMLFDILDRDTLARIQSLKQSLEQSRTNLLLYPPLVTTNSAFRNRGNFQFEDASQPWGFTSQRVSQGIALADLDGDADLDLAINCLNSPPLIYRNDSPEPRLAVRLQGQKPNLHGIGARLRVSGSPAGPQLQEMLAGGRYLSGDQPIRMFAAGASNAIEVLWRSGKRSVVPDVKPNRIYEITEPSTDSIPAPSTREKPVPHFQDVTERLGGHGHREEFYPDYAQQPLLMKQLSQLGPGVGWIDLDGDGHDELIIGPARSDHVAVFKPGRERFTRTSSDWVAPDDTTGVAYWVNSQGQRTALIGVANYEALSTNRPAVFEWRNAQVRPLTAIPNGTGSTGPLAVTDLEGDGDLDLFVGGRTIPAQYPRPDSSRIFRLDGNSLRLDEQNSRLLRDVGLVSGAIWSDLTGDGFAELILACEWGPIKIFRNEQGQLSPWNPSLDQQKTLAELTGWWNSVTTGDFDGDGRMDIVAGNWGLNDGYRASESEPLSLYYGNIAGGPAVDLIETYHAPELRAEVPRRTFGVLLQAFPGLAQFYPSHRAFSTLTASELLARLPHPAQKLSVVSLASTLFLNRGTTFVPVALPMEAQLAPVFSLNVADADGDGHEDLFISQNFFAVRPEWPRLDAGRGLWLRGNGIGSFSPIPSEQSGIAVFGEQRGAALTDFNLDGRIDLAVSQNGALTRLFQNVTAKPGLHLRLKGPVGNPDGIGAIVRLVFGDQPGPAREIHGGSGYWSQDSVRPVLALPRAPSEVQVTWPGGRVTRISIPPGGHDVTIRHDSN